jgi:hypothetical protein
VRLLAALVTAVALVAVTAAARATTIPSALVQVHVSLTARAVALSPRSAPRGSTVVFGVRNRTASTRSFTLGGKRVLVPAQKLRFLGFEFDRRGKYGYVSRGAGSVVRGTFRVS